LLMKGITMTNGNGTGANFSGNGGAIVVNQNARLIMYNSAVKNNTATLTDASGLKAPALVSGKDSVSTVQAEGGGGGIYNLGTIYMVESTISGNKATLSGAGASGGGGGIYNQGYVEILYSSIESNIAEPANSSFAVGAGGIYNGFRSGLSLN